MHTETTGYNGVRNEHVADGKGFNNNSNNVGEKNSAGWQHRRTQHTERTATRKLHFGQSRLMMVCGGKTVCVCTNFNVQSFAEYDCKTENLIKIF